MPASSSRTEAQSPEAEDTEAAEDDEIIPQGPVCNLAWPYATGAW